MAQTQGEAQNLVWVYLSQCITFEPSQLNAYKVREDWFVKAPAKSNLQFGIWKVDVMSGDLEPYDILSQEWRPYVESGCSAEKGVGLVPVTPTPTVVPSPTPTRTPRPTPTYTPMPTATPVVPNTTDAVASVWSYLVKCFPDAELTDLEAVLDPVLDQYVVKDKDEIQYGVWRINQSDGVIKPDNDWARRRDETVRSGTC